MKTLFLDFETSTTENKRGKQDPSPFIPGNFIVSYGWRTHGYEIESRGYNFICHRDFSGDSGSNRHILQSLLDQCELLVAFNAKFEMEWLLETGFKYDGPVSDPMATEYILARGVTCPLDLDSCCERRGTVRKLGSLVDNYFDCGIGFDKMPMGLVEEYGNRDVDCLYELHFKHLELLGQEENVGLNPTVQMSNEFLLCLVDMERNGICIDAKALSDVKEEFTRERDKLKQELENIIKSVMGDTSINLNSPEQLSWVIYSRRVKDKHVWAELFNIGTDARGKRNRPPRMSTTAFVDSVKRHTEILKRTSAKHCETCRGRGRLLDKLTVSGRPFKSPPKCRDCGGNGYTLVNLGQPAGFRLAPRGPIDTASGGFATDKETIEALIQRYSSNSADNATSQGCGVLFLQALIRYGAVDTYLNTFVAGIERGLGVDNILHTKLMQCITKTGRLSSQDPNFQNMPRAKTFPIRRAVHSRFKDGKIIEVDFKTLEFRTAAYLYQDEQAIRDIAANVDVHSFTATTITEAGQATDRQGAKEHTFKPLYGGSSGTAAEQMYYAAFKEKYKGVAAGQKKDIQTVLRVGVLTTPSGRQYRFLGTKRTPNGYVTNTTQICNYPVQGFATGDIVPITVIECRKEILKRCEVLKRTVMFLTVHDSIEWDVPPEEVEQVIDLINVCFKRLPEILKERYGIRINVPLDWEIKIGDNWMNLKEVA